MALKNNYEIKVIYTLGKFASKDCFKDILTNKQIEELNNNLEKSFIVPNAYIKIEDLKGNKENIEIYVSVYKDSTKQICVATKKYSFMPVLESDDNFIKQGYIFLKSLYEYADAIDC